MKNLSAKQIAQVKEIKNWTSTRFHGNTKKVGELLLADIKEIVAKKNNRAIAKVDKGNRSNIQKVKELLKWSLECKNTNYFKILIEGNNNIYYAHPGYGHSDYNKACIFPKNAETLKLMQLFNSIVNK